MSLHMTVTQIFRKCTLTLHHKYNAYDALLYYTNIILFIIPLECSHRPNTNGIKTVS